MPFIEASQRRDLLVRRSVFAGQACLPADRGEAIDAVKKVTALHSTEPATVYLAIWARVPDVTIADIERALFEDRNLVKQLAMRRTLFAFPRELLGAAWGSASARVAGQLERQLAKEAESAGVARSGSRWLAEAKDATLACLSDGVGRTAVELREQVPELAGTLSFGSDQAWAGSVPLAPRVITWLGAEGLLVRAENRGHWRTSRPVYRLMSDWLGQPPAPLPEREGYAALVRAWLASFGPGTRTDLQWWLGATAGAVTAALADIDAVPVELEGGDQGWVLPGDLDTPVEPAPPTAALLPVLDATVMAWKQRDFYLGPHAAMLFDRNGNAGTTAWWEGRVVGCWVQAADATVVVHLLEEVPAAAVAALEAEAARLTTWLDGVIVKTVYPSPAMKAAKTALGV